MRARAIRWCRLSLLGCLTLELNGCAPSVVSPAPAAPAASAAPAPPQPEAAPLAPSPGRDALFDIYGAAMTSSRTLEWVEELADDIGPRSTGTPACQKAEAWAASQLEALGYAPRRETWELGWSWTPGPARADLLEPVQRQLVSVPCHGAPGTPDGGVIAPVVELKLWEPLPPDLAGKVVLAVPRDLNISSRHEMSVKMAELNQRLHEVGAAALLVASEAVPRSLLASEEGGPPPALPQFSISLDDARVIHRLNKDGAVRVRVESQARLGPPGTPPANVIADLPGSGPDMVLLMAHLDSVGYAPGATDDGAGVAVVLEVARILRGLGSPLRRGVRFILFTGEEQGLLGATAYVDRHREELGHYAAAIELDTGAARIAGLFRCGRADLGAPLTYALDPLRSQNVRDATGNPEEALACTSTDLEAFLMTGVPSFGVEQDIREYWAALHHRPLDTPDTISPGDLQFDAAALAIVAWRLATDDGPMGSRASPEQVKAILDKWGILDAVPPGLKKWVP